jgi:hypothetical protein
MHKSENITDITQAMFAVKDAGFELVIYTIIGAGYADRNAWLKTIDFIERLRPTSIMVNTAAYLDFDDPLAKYDAHFSPVSARRYRVDYDIWWRLLQLQGELSNPGIQVMK